MSRGKVKCALPEIGVCAGREWPRVCGGVSGGRASTLPAMLNNASFSR